MSDPDIVARLRIATLPSVCCVKREAADEIERLREQLRLANIDNFNTTAEVDRFRTERDEARRMYCEKMSNISRQQKCTPQWFAEEEGWDCFTKEDEE